MNNQTERFLGFASEKSVIETGFYYYFNNEAINFLPDETSELQVILTFEGELQVRYIQCSDHLEEAIDEETTFLEDVKIAEIITWLKSKIK